MNGVVHRERVRQQKSRRPRYRHVALEEPLIGAPLAAVWQATAAEPFTRSGGTHQRRPLWAGDRAVTQQKSPDAWGVPIASASRPACCGGGRRQRVVSPPAAVTTVPEFLATAVSP